MGDGLPSSKLHSTTNCTHTLSPFIIHALIHFNFTLMHPSLIFTDHLLCSKHQACSPAAEGGAWDKGKLERKTSRAVVGSPPKEHAEGMCWKQARILPHLLSLPSRERNSLCLPGAGEIGLAWHRSPRLISISGAFLCLSPATQQVACPSCRESGFSSHTSFLHDCLVKTA